MGTFMPALLHGQQDVNGEPPVRLHPTAMQTDPIDARGTDPHPSV